MANTSVLLVVLSGSYPRRRLLRCSYSAQRAHMAHVRVLFLVGRPRNASSNARGGGFGGVPDLGAPDVMALPVSDGSAAEGSAPPMSGSLTALLKVFFFLQFAANQPERHIVKADDDTFVSVPALLAYADAMPPRYFAGVFESSSWIPSRAVMIGWGMHPEWTKRTHGHRYHNCTRDGSVPDTYGDYQPGDVCTGPFWFAKGPLRMLDREAARALLFETSFFSDFAKIASVPARHAKLSNRARRIVSEDAQMGYWASQVPRLNYVPLQTTKFVNNVKGAWREAWDPKVAAFGGDVLALHRFPYTCHAAAASAVVAAWSGGGGSRRATAHCPSSNTACGRDPRPGRTLGPGGVRGCVASLAHPGVPRRMCEPVVLAPTAARALSCNETWKVGRGYRRIAQDIPACAV